MNAYQTDDAGNIGIVVQLNDLAVPLIDFSESDVLEGASWKPFPQGIDAYRNIGRGRYSDPRPQSLYQLVDFPDIRLPALGGIDRILSEDFADIQSPSMAQRVMKQRLLRLQYLGEFEATFGPRGYIVRIGSVVRLTFSPQRWANKLFRVVSRGVAMNGRVPLTLREEHASIYSWLNEDQAPITLASPAAFNAMNDPVISMLSGIDEGATRNVILASGEAQDGVAVTFTPVLDVTPVIIFEPGGIKGATTGRDIRVEAIGVTATGFVPVIQERIATVGATVTDSPAVAGNGTTEPQFMINRSNAGQPYDDRFVFDYSVTVPEAAPGEPGSLVLQFWVMLATGWAAAGQRRHTGNANNVKFSAMYTNVAFGAGNEFGISILEGTGSFVFNNVTYTLGTTTTVSLAPPAGTVSVKWTAVNP